MSISSLVRRRMFIVLLALGAALVIAAACNGDGDGDEAPTTGETPTDGETPAAGATAEIKMLVGTTFDRSELVIAADTDVTITAENTDGTHNFAIYDSQADAEAGEEPIAQTEIHGAPFTDSVTVNLPPGEHFYRCEVHPQVMTGTLIAQ